MGSLQKQWQQVLAVTTEVDLTFLLLRVFSLVGGFVWIMVGDPSAAGKGILINALGAFFSTASCSIW